jgi:hypothetical protein
MSGGREGAVAHCACDRRTKNRIRTGHVPLPIPLRPHRTARALIAARGRHERPSQDLGCGCCSLFETTTLVTSLGGEGGTATRASCPPRDARLALQRHPRRLCVRSGQYAIARGTALHAPAAGLALPRRPDLRYALWRLPLPEGVGPGDPVRLSGPERGVGKWSYPREHLPEPLTEARPVVTGTADRCHGLPRRHGARHVRGLGASCLAITACATLVPSFCLVNAVGPCGPKGN